MPRRAGRRVAPARRRRGDAPLRPAERSSCAAAWRVAGERARRADRCRRARRLLARLHPRARTPEPTLEATRTYRPPNIRHLPDAGGHINPSRPYPSSLHISVVEVDPRDRARVAAAPRRDPRLRHDDQPAVRRGSVPGRDRHGLRRDPQRGVPHSTAPDTRERHVQELPAAARAATSPDRAWPSGDAQPVHPPRREGRGRVRLRRRASPRCRGVNDALGRSVPASTGTPCTVSNGCSRRPRRRGRRDDRRALRLPRARRAHAEALARSPPTPQGTAILGGGTWLIADLGVASHAAQLIDLGAARARRDRASATAGCASGRHAPTRTCSARDGLGACSAARADGGAGSRAERDRGQGTLGGSAERARPQSDAPARRGRRRPRR